jgi:hypothetical protein
MALECTTFGLREYLRRVSWAVDVEYLLDLFIKHTNLRTLSPMSAYAP